MGFIVGFRVSGFGPSGRPDVEPPGLRVWTCVTAILGTWGGGDTTLNPKP